MKKRIYMTKLALNKKTIADLKNEELNTVKGGKPSNATPCGGTHLTLCCTGFFPCP